MAIPVLVTAVVDESMLEALDHYASATGQSRDRIIETALLAYLNGTRDLPVEVQDASGPNAQGASAGGPG
jgi:predicted transcriptional regulator